MAKKGEQLDLINTDPENAEELMKTLRKYEDVKSRRCKLSTQEVALKGEILDHIHSAKLKPIDGKGKIQFTLAGAKVTVTPKSEKLSVEFEKTEPEQE